MNEPAMRATMIPSAPDRKAALVAESARLRGELRMHLAPVSSLQGLAQATVVRAGALARRPAVLAAVGVGVAVIGPRRLLRALRWGLWTLPANPAARRVLASLGAATLEAMAPAGRQDATSTARASRARDPGS